MTISLPEVVVLTGASSGMGKQLAEVLVAGSPVVIGVDVVPPPDALAAHERFRSISGSVDAPETWQTVTELIETLPGTVGLASVAATLVQGRLPRSLLPTGSGLSPSTSSPPGWPSSTCSPS